MKILIIGDRGRYEKFQPDLPAARESEMIFCPRGTSDEELLEKGKDAEILLADAISPVSKKLIDGMPRLKMIHSEGVAFNAIDIQAAAERGVYVCNNKGANAGAVAEQAIYLMLALLRDGIAGQEAVLAGRQILMKEQKMREGITDLGDCAVGLIGFGDIAKETAVRLAAFGCRLYYWSAHRKDPETEEKYGVTWLEKNELLETCDIVSIHTAVNTGTVKMVNREFLSHMKKDAWFINTARGEVVDNEAMREALTEGRIAGAGFDTIAPEPTAADNPLVALPADCKARVIYSPHLGGITSGSFRRIYRSLWENVGRVERGERPIHIVNGL